MEIGCDYSEDKDVQVIAVVVTTQLRRGDGTPDNPIRRVLQVHTFDGTLIAEHDPERLVD